MAKRINVAIEYNDEGTMLYLIDYAGAFTRGSTREIALSKVQKEYDDYYFWRYQTKNTESHLELNIVQEYYSELQIADADTDIIFETEKDAISIEHYQCLRKLVIKSAYDFQMLYDSVPDKNYFVNKPRDTFYGKVPITPIEMYNHTNSVTSFYLDGIHITLKDTNNIYTNRCNAVSFIDKDIKLLENQPVFTHYEYWTLSKVLRRFIWHDRIHAKALYRLATSKWQDEIINSFHF